MLKVASAVAGSLFLGCATLAGPALAQSDVTVGFSAASSGWPWFASFINRLDARSQEEGWQTVVLSANGDVPTQLNQIYDLVAQKVDYLIVGPADGSAVIPGLKAAKEAGIPVIIIGNPVAPEGEDYVTATRVPDDAELGAGSANLMVQALGDGKSIVIIDGLPGQPAVTIRHQAMDPIWQAHNIQVLAVQPANWDSTMAASVTEDLLTRFPDVDGVFSLDGAMTPGVLRALQDIGYEGPVVGLGGTKTELEAIRSGQLYGTTCMSPGNNANAAMDVIDDLIAGKTVEKTEIVHAPQITKENVDSCPGDW